MTLTVITISGFYPRDDDIIARNIEIIRYFQVKDVHVMEKYRTFNPILQCWNTKINNTLFLSSFMFLSPKPLRFVREKEIKKFVFVTKILRESFFWRIWCEKNKKKHMWIVRAIKKFETNRVQKKTAEGQKNS